MGDKNEKELIAISVYKDVVVDINRIQELKEKIAQLLSTEVENISIEAGWDGEIY